MTLFGIPNCDTVKKARTWLTQAGVDAPFHDFKKQGLTEDQVRTWLKHVPWEKLVNRAGTTWRQLPDDVKAGVSDEAAAIRLMLDKPSVIKRPVLQLADTVEVGFSEDRYRALFNR